MALLIESLKLTLTASDVAAFSKTEAYRIWKDSDWLVSIAE